VYQVHKGLCGNAVAPFQQVKKMSAEQTSVEQIDVIHIDDMSDAARADVESKAKAQGMKNFQGYAEIRMVTASPMRVDEKIEPIEGTPVEWFKQKNRASEIDTSDIF